MKTTETTMLHIRIMNAQADVNRAREDLRQDVQRLVDRLGKVGVELQHLASIDALGVVRELGLEVDRKCAVLAYAEKSLAEWQAFADHAREWTS